ncbi:unnamed protein product [Schistosoma curassoni]|uniref:Uncharacterized protein n=1 Tax=Schistosoma curassoni TaxID=6186 RepID=A0A183K237_9TREM|nr:unnamed protein product [Schistosoma curassoni]
MFTSGLEPSTVRFKRQRAFRPTWDWSTGCTCISELLFTLRLEPSTVCF